MTNQTKHKVAPWKKEDGSYDDAYIEKAVNSYESLVAACKQVLRDKTNQYGETPELSSDLRKTIEKALRKAEGR